MFYSKTIFIEQLTINNDVATFEIQNALMNLGEPAGIKQKTGRDPEKPQPTVPEREAKLVTLKLNDTE